jgi:hypothetical protein
MGSTVTMHHSWIIQYSIFAYINCRNICWAAFHGIFSNTVYSYQLCLPQNLSRSATHQYSGFRELPCEVTIITIIIIIIIIIRVPCSLHHRQPYITLVYVHMRPSRVSKAVDFWNSLEVGIRSELVYTSAGFHGIP